MRSHPRIRETVKWGGAMMCAVLLEIGALSGWCRVSLGHIGGWESWCYRGRLGVLAPSNGWHTPDAPGIGRFEEEFRLDWWFEQNRYTRPRVVALTCGDWSIPLWFPILLCAGSFAIVWRLDTLARRRARLGACPKCSYSRAGLAPSAVCPECGSTAGNETPAAR